MRNDAKDELQYVPSLTAVREESRSPQAAYAESGGRGRRSERSGGAVGLLWGLVLLLATALGALSWWSFQQLTLLERQLVATQESFAKVSEEASGRLQAISGKVVAAESSVTTESEALKLRIAQLERQLVEVSRQQQLAIEQQRSLEDRLLGQDRRVAEQNGQFERLTSDLRTQQSGAAQLAERAGALEKAQASLLAEQATFKAALADQSRLKAVMEDQTRLSAATEALRQELERVKSQGDQRQAIGRLEQDLLILRSQLDSRPAGGASVAEFDAFRAQMTRNISTLQTQVANLQAQLKSR